MRELKYIDYLITSNRKQIKSGLPSEAWFEITYNCNLKCVHCYVVRNKNEKELSTNQVFSILDQLTDIGIWRLDFTGGEPFVRKDMIKILLYAKRCGFDITVFTNATLITEEVADTLIDNGINRFEISFQAAQPQTFDRITQIKDSYEKVLSNVKMLKKKGGLIKLKVSVLNLNSGEINEIYKLAKDLKVVFRYSCWLLPKMDGDTSIFSYRISPEELLNIDIKEKNYSIQPKRNLFRLRTYPRRLTVRAKAYRRDRLFTCGVGKNIMKINPYGRLNTCIGLPFPNYDILKGSIKEGWEEVKKFVENARPPKNWGCNKCEIWDYCSVCPVRCHLETGDMAGCPEYYREVALLAKEKRETYYIKEVREDV